MTLEIPAPALYARRMRHHPGVVPWDKLSRTGQQYWTDMAADAAEVATLTPTPAMVETFRLAYYNNPGGAGDDPIALALTALLASPCMAEALQARPAETARAAE